MKQEQKGQPLSNLSNTELVIAKMMENNAQGRPGNEAVKFLGFGVRSRQWRNQQARDE